MITTPWLATFIPSVGLRHWYARVYPMSVALADYFPSPTTHGASYLNTSVSVYNVFVIYISLSHGFHVLTRSIYDVTAKPC